MSKLSRLGLLTLIAAAGYVGATAWVGAHVRTEFEASTAALTRQLPFAKVLDQRYDKGLFSATRTTRLQLGCVQMPPDDHGQPRPRQPLVITWRDHIQNGPLPGFKALGAATVDTELVVPDAVQRHLTEVFGKQPPLTIHTLVGWDGSTRTQIASPKASYKDPAEGEVLWSGLSGTINRAAGPNAPSSSDITIPSLELKSPQGTDHVIFKQARIHFEGTTNPDMLWLGVGQGEAELGSIDVQITPRHGDEAGKAMKGTLSNLKYHTDTTLDNGLLAAKGSITGSARFGDTVVNQIRMDLSLKNIHAESYVRLMKNATAHSLSCDAPTDESPAQAMQQMQADLQPLLVFNPEYSMDHLIVEIDGKKGEASYALGIHGATEADKQTPLPALLLGKGFVKASAKLPLAWLDQLAALSGGKGGTNPGDMARSMLDQFASQGYVVLDQDSVSSSFSFAQGKMELNGHPFATPAMAGPRGMPAGNMPPEMAMPAP